MVKQNKTKIIGDVVGLNFLAPSILGAGVFSAQWLGEAFFDMKHMLLGQSLNLFGVLDGMTHAYGIGFMGMLGAFAISRIKDKKIFDNWKQMLAGLGLGAVGYVGLTFFLDKFDWFTITQFAEFGMIANVTLGTAYAIARFSGALKQ